MSSDFDHLWSGDIGITASGKIALVDGTTKGEQRVLRRLMTNPGEYMWHPEYGAGLPRYVGANLRIPELEGVIRQQLRLEATVAQIPVPVLKIAPILNGVFVRIIWVDAESGQRANVEFDLTP